MIFRDVAPCDGLDAEAVAKRLRALLADHLALAGGETRQEVVESLIAAIGPVELLPGSLKQPDLTEPPPFLLQRKRDVER